MSAREERGGNSYATRRGRRLSRQSRFAATCCAMALTLPLAQGRAQASAISLPTVWLGGGIAAGNDNTGNASLATTSGATMVAAVEFPMSRDPRPSRFALRAEGGWSQQSLATTPGGALSGDVQTMSTGLALRVSPFDSHTSAARRFSPYLLAGVGLARSSTRVLVSIIEPEVPSAQFGQTSSELAATGVGAIGTQVRLARMRLFVEARTALARRDPGTLRTSLVLMGITLAPHR